MTLNVERHSGVKGMNGELGGGRSSIKNIKENEENTKVKEMRKNRRRKEIEGKNRRDELRRRTAGQKIIDTTV